MKMAGEPGTTRVLGNIQSLRAVAAWAVVYYHYAHHFYDLKPTSLVLKAVCFYGNFGVDLFFVISGVIMFYSASQRQVSAREFISKRLVRIVPAYWFYSLLLFLLVICPVELLRPDVPYTWKTLADSIVFISDDSDPGGAKAPLLYVGWTLTFEMIFYSIFAVGLVLPTRRKLLLVFLAVLMIPVVWPATWPAARVLRDYRMFEFATGMAAGAFWLRFQSKWKFHDLLAGLFIMTGLAMLVLMRGPYYMAGRVLASTFIVLGALFDQTFVKFKLSNWLGKLGDYSYSTYLVHPIVMMLFYRCFGNSISRPEEWLLIMVISLVVYGISVMSWRWVENGPPRHAIEKLMRRIGLNHETKSGLP